MPKMITIPKPKPKFQEDEIEISQKISIICEWRLFAKTSCVFVGHPITPSVELQIHLIHHRRVRALLRDRQTSPSRVSLTDRGPVTEFSTKLSPCLRLRPPDARGKTARPINREDPVCVFVKKCDYFRIKRLRPWDELRYSMPSNTRAPECLVLAAEEISPTSVSHAPSV